MAKRATLRNFSVRNGTKGKLPRLPFKLAKKYLLGEGYELSLAFVGEKDSEIMNEKYRGKRKPANVLSFPLSEKSGEIVICPKEARRGASEFHMDYRSFIFLLFIHGLLHLKGMRHGSKMEAMEKAALRKFL